MDPRAAGEIFCSSRSASDTRSAALPLGAGVKCDLTNDEGRVSRLRARAGLLQAEIQSAHEKEARLRRAIQIRQRNLNRLQAQIAFDGAAAAQTTCMKPHPMIGFA